MKADQRINFRPILKLLAYFTVHGLSKNYHISKISISLHLILDKISFIGLLWTFFFIAQTPKTIEVRVVLVVCVREVYGASS